MALGILHAIGNDGCVTMRSRTCRVGFFRNVPISCVVQYWYSKGIFFMALTAKLRSPFGLGESLSEGISLGGWRNFRLLREIPGLSIKQNELVVS